MSRCKQCDLDNHPGCTGTLHSGDSPMCQCDCDWAPDAVAVAAKEQLEKAIKSYYAIMEPEVYIADYVLVCHKMSSESETSNQTVISHLVGTGQAWPMTIVMLTAVLDHERSRGTS